VAVDLLQPDPLASRNDLEQSGLEAGELGARVSGSPCTHHFDGHPHGDYMEALPAPATHC